MESSAPAATIDMGQLEEQLSKLLDAYRSALRTVSRLPKLGRLETTALGTKGSTPKKRWLVRAFVRPFVETHIRGKIDTLIELLNIEAISLKANDENIIKIAGWIKRLEETRKVLLGWGRYYRLATKIPLISVFLPLVGAFLLQFIGRSGGWVVFSRNAAILLFYLYMILAPLVMSLGFRVKRAIFCGAVTVPIRLIKPDGDEKEYWNGIPTIDIFDAENQLFQSLKTVKPREFPLDLVFRVIPYILLLTGLTFTVNTLREVWAQGYPTIHNILGLGYWLIVVLAFYSPIQYYRQRRRENKI